MDRINQSLVYSLYLLFLTACGGGGSGSAAEDDSFCADIDSRRTFASIMREHYLWYDKLPAINLNDQRYCSLVNLLNDLRYSVEDRFSYIQTKEEHGNFFQEGAYRGFGFGYRSDAGVSVIAFVYTNSAAGWAGINRFSVYHLAAQRQKFPSRF